MRKKKKKKKKRKKFDYRECNKFFSSYEFTKEKICEGEKFFFEKNFVRNIVDVDEFFRSSDESRRRDFAVKFCTGVVNPDIKSWTVSGLRSLGVSVCGDEKKKERKKERRRKKRNEKLRALARPTVSFHVPQSG